MFSAVRKRRLSSNLPTEVVEAVMLKRKASPGCALFVLVIVALFVLVIVALFVSVTCSRETAKA